MSNGSDEFIRDRGGGRGGRDVRLAHFSLGADAEGYELVPKITSGFADTYIDVRTFGVSDWANHKPLVAAIVRADKQEILEHSSAENLTEGVQDMLKGLGHVPATKAG